MRLDPADTAHLDEAMLAKVRNVIYVGPFVDATARAASDVWLPATAWAEEDGTLVNFEGRIQRVRRAHLPRGESRPGWRVVTDIGIGRRARDPPGLHVVVGRPSRSAGREKCASSRA